MIRPVALLLALAGCAPASWRPCEARMILHAPDGRLEYRHGVRGCSGDCECVDEPERMLRIPREFTI